MVLGDCEAALGTIQRMLAVLQNIATEYTSCQSPPMCRVNATHTAVDLHAHHDPFPGLGKALPPGSYRDCAGECEVNALLLMLLLPSPIRARQQFRGTLER